MSSSFSPKLWQKLKQEERRQYDSYKRGQSPEPQSKLNWTLYENKQPGVSSLYTNMHHTICTQYRIPLLPYTHTIVTSLTIYTHIAWYHLHTCTHLECMPWPWVWGCSVGLLLSPPLPPTKGGRTRVYQECRGWGLTLLLLAVASESLFQAIEHLRTAEREWSTREWEKASG